MAGASFDQLLRQYLDIYGGVVIERLVSNLKPLQPDAPELADRDALKAYVEANSDTYKIQTSSTGVERVKLASPSPQREGPLVSTLQALQDAKAFDPESACAASDLYHKAVDSYRAEHGEEAALPFYLVSKEDFLRALRAHRRVRRKEDSVFLLPRQQRKAVAESAHDGQEHAAENGENGSAAANNGDGSRRPAAPPEPIEPKAVNLPDAPNDATYVCYLVYVKLCERGATSIETGLPIKVLMRHVSVAFKEARPESTHESMTALRVFKLLTGQLPGLKRQRPRPRRRGTRPEFPLEPLLWIEDGDALVAAIEAGVSDEVKAEVMEDAEAIAAGQPREVVVQEQPQWKTAVVGPTADVAVLDRFLAEHDDQAVWGFETEHRVGMNSRRPAGKLALIVLSHMHHTIIWDAFQGGVPDSLRAFLASESKFKGGIKIKAKASKLLSQYNAETSKFVELGQVASDLGELSDEERERVSMRVLTQNVLKRPVTRPISIRDSNWELRPLTPRQYTYAVEDGYVTALLFMQMVAKLHSQDKGAKLNEACIPPMRLAGH